MGCCGALTRIAHARAVSGFPGYLCRFSRRLGPLLACWAVAAGLSGCGANEVQPVMSDLPVPDFSGYWEIDYARSDGVQNQLNSTFREVQREIRRRNEAAERGESHQGPALGDIDTLFALARMAELVVEPTLLEIDQDAQWIRIERENSFALVCSLSATGEATTRLGQEVCWWDGQEWHFVIQLPDGLRVAHGFIRSQDGDSLAQRTRLSDPRSGRDFVVSQIFGRYDPLERGYTCTQTLSKGRVCTTESVDTE